MSKIKVYIYDSEDTARKIAKTVDKHLGIEVERIGSVVIMDQEYYNLLCDGTYSPTARLVTELS